MTKILIIEDEKNLRVNLEYVLKLENYQVLQAKNGLEGSKMAKEHLPDLIICDIMMPKLNGYQVLTELRKDKNTSAIPFIFLTAKGTKIDFRKGMRLGADDYISKPFEVEDLLMSVKARLQRRDEVSKKVEKLRLKVSDILPHAFRESLNEIRGLSEILRQAQNLQINLDAVTEMAESIYKNEVTLERLIENYDLYVNLSSDCPTTIWRSNIEMFTPKIIENIALQKAESIGREQDLSLNLAEVGFNFSVNSFIKILDELLDNAFNFSQSGQQVKLESKLNGDEFSLIIKDYGQGMLQEQIDKVGPFIQFHRDKHNQKGLGLGLFIVKELVKLHDGKIHIDSKINEGTTCSVYIHQAI